MNIHDRLRDDDVIGVIVGRGFIAGRLFYEGRPQSRLLLAPDDAALIERARIEKESRRMEFGEAFRAIWPSDSAWELRIFQ